jgi:hypothetical protein
MTFGWSLRSFLSLKRFFCLNTAMKFISKTGLRNLLAVGGFLVLSTAYVVHDGFSSSSGVTGATNKKGHSQGCQCHATDESAEPQITLTTTATTFEPGKTYRFVLTVSDPEQVAAGTNIAKFLGGDTATSSKLYNVNTELRRSSLQLTHRSPKDYVDGGTSWEFDYIAPTNPAQLRDTIYAAVNSVNGNNNTTGDRWAFAPKFAINITPSSVSPRTDIAEAFAIGPNPARNSTKLFFTMKKAADLRIAVLDASGREVFVQHQNSLTSGRGEVILDLANLATGDYLVNVTSAGSLLYTGKIAHTK